MKLSAIPSLVTVHLATPGLQNNCPSSDNGGPKFANVRQNYNLSRTLLTFLSEQFFCCNIWLYHLQIKLEFLICYSFNCAFVLPKFRAKSCNRFWSSRHKHHQMATTFLCWRLDSNHLLRHCVLLENNIGRFLVLKHWE